MNHDAFADVDDVVLLYLNAVDSGEAPDPTDWLARFPRFAEQLRPFFDVERGIGRVAAITHPKAIDDTPSPGRHSTSFAEFPELGSRYDEIEHVGRGGMGYVMRARDKLLGRTVAIKVLQRRHQAQAGMAERFLDEARIAASLQHPGVPAIHDVGAAQDGRPFLVMKLIEGATLTERLRKRPDVNHDLPWFLKVFEQVAQTVAYAHSRGVLHRDLKPHNVMNGAFGEVQVMDWGLAKSDVGGQRLVPAH